MGCFSSRLPKFFPTPLLEKVALISLILNGINLLPVLPLDGGWVLHAILFSRHFMLETAFQIFAAATLITASFMGQGQIWGYLGIAMLVGTRSLHCLAKVARSLRNKGIASGATGDQAIPRETVSAILTELKAAVPGQQFAKQFATQTLAIFQKLNAIPPGALASTALLALYLAAGAGAVLGTGAVSGSRVERRERQFATFHPEPPSRSPAGTLTAGGGGKQHRFRFALSCRLVHEHPKQQGGI